MDLAAKERQTYETWLLLHFRRFLSDAKVHEDAFKAAMAKTPRRYIGVSVADALEGLAGVSPDALAAFDADCIAAGLPSLKEVRLRFGRRIHAILARGRIRDETEYYLLRSVVDGIDDPVKQQPVLDMLNKFEERT